MLLQILYTAGPSWLGYTAAELRLALACHRPSIAPATGWKTTSGSWLRYTRFCGAGVCTQSLGCFGYKGLLPRNKGSSVQGKTVVFLNVKKCLHQFQLYENQDKQIFFMLYISIYIHTWCPKHPCGMFLLCAVTTSLVVASTRWAACSPVYFSFFLS